MQLSIEDLRGRIDEIYDEVVSFRRDLHMHPELSEKEEQTSRKILERLAALGIPCQSGIAGHGVIGTIYGQNRDTAVALRADIDALPVREMTDVPYKSLFPGVMHACGHDIHTAILFGTAKILSEMKELLSGSVKLFFQPSEETIGGAKRMIETGCLKHPQVTNVIGLHVEPSIPAGKVLFIPGVMNAASCEFYVTIIGKSCHGAHPNSGVDPLLPACTMVSSLQSIITRRLDPAEPGLITIGQFHSGTKTNIIPSETKFSGIIRTLTAENREFIKREIDRVCNSIATSYHAECVIKFFDTYPPLVNSDDLYHLAVNVATEVLGKDNIVISPKPSLGADDFAYFCHGCRGFYYMLGSGLPDGQKSYPLHSDLFNPDESCIKTGILTQITLARNILEKESL